MTQDEIRRYLDESIALWRDIRDGKAPAPQGRVDLAEAYIDALQSMRLSVFGALLPGDADPTRIPDSSGPHVEPEPTGREIKALGWLSAHFAGLADAWNGNAPDWFPEPPEWITLWEQALKETADA